MPEASLLAELSRAFAEFDSWRLAFSALMLVFRNNAMAMSGKYFGGNTENHDVSGERF